MFQGWRKSDYLGTYLDGKLNMVGDQEECFVNLAQLYPGRCIRLHGVNNITLEVGGGGTSDIRQTSEEGDVTSTTRVDRRCRPLQRLGGDLSSLHVHVWLNEWIKSKKLRYFSMYIIEFHTCVYIMYIHIFVHKRQLRFQHENSWILRMYINAPIKYFLCLTLLTKINDRRDTWSEIIKFVYFIEL